MANTSIGTGANQIPINANLGKLAYVDVIDTTDIFDYSDKSNTIFNQANTGISIGQSAFTQANTANTGLSTKAALKGTATEYGGAKFSLTGTTLTITTT